MQNPLKIIAIGVFVIICILIYSGVATGPEIGSAIGDSIRSAVHN
jgi:hypothetical protein